MLSDHLPKQIRSASVMAIYCSCQSTSTHSTVFRLTSCQLQEMDKSYSRHRAGSCGYARSDSVKVSKSQVTLSKFFELICASGVGLCQEHLCGIRPKLYQLLQRTSLGLLKLCKNLSIQRYLLPQDITTAFGNSLLKVFQRLWLSLL